MNGDGKNKRSNRGDQPLAALINWLWSRSRLTVVVASIVTLMEVVV